ncbi:ATP-dependent RNA helicase [Perkinsela sp. CCAP 1560/4]|nr:ATP-dependent RNA helicase [Perkinsela sp. CCAP 1560/4]|eukprot:KNH06623.1 ATP-dependent RNA helicase [Perkinsela sp. CCAP 1560/4]
MPPFLLQIYFFTISHCETPHAVISGGCGVQVLLEDYYHLNGEGLLGYIFPGFIKESVTYDGTLAKFPCFSVRRNLRNSQHSGSFSLGELYGCSLKKNSTVMEEFIFCERENSIVTISGDIPPPGTVGRISNFLNRHLGRKVPCVGARTGCERPDITKQPDWGQLGGRTIHASSNFTAIQDWEENKRDGRIASFGNGYSEGWCVPDLKSIDPSLPDNDVFPSVVLLKCPCFTTHKRSEACQPQEVINNSSELLQQHNELPSKDALAIQFPEDDWQSFLLRGDWMSETINTPLLQAIIRTSTDVTQTVSRSFVDLLYTVILLVIVLRSIIWWVEAM